MSTDSRLEQRIVVFAPSANDGPVTARVLAKAGLECVLARDRADLCRLLDEGASVALVSEEALDGATARAISERLQAQPPWSDFPILIFTTAASRGAGRFTTIESLATFGNVTLLDRPVEVITLVSSVRAALRARGRQYAARGVLEERARLYDAERVARDRLGRLQRVTAALNEAATREAIGDCLADVCEGVGASAGALYVLNDAGTELEAVRVIGMPQEHAEAARRLPLTLQLALTAVVKHRAPAFARSREDYERSYEPLATSPVDLEARATMPLIVHDLVIGSLAVAFRHPRSFSDDERQFLEAASDRFAQALERAHLLELERRSLDALKREIQFNEMFVGILGHDLRNPLGSIVSAASLLMLHDELSDRQRRAVQHIARAGDRMARMVSQLLDVTRSRVGGGIEITRQPCELASIVRQVVTELQLTHPDQTFVIEGRGLIMGDWDADRLAQLVSNLVGNAATHGEGSPVRVSVEATDEGARLRVHNGGKPIPEDVLPTLFEPYVRGRHATASHGLGLGLYISAQVVRAHGGRIDVSSTESEGTTFTVALPRQMPS